MFDIHIDRINSIEGLLPDNEKVIALPIVKHVTMIFPSKQSEREFVLDLR